MSEQTVTVSPADLAAMIAQAVAAAMPAKKAKATGEKKERKPLTEEQKAERRAKVDELTLVAFKEKGYKDVQPRINVMTYDKWIENGRRVRKGEKSVKCGSWPLFHLDQTDEIATKH
jgi:hypothetical protein